MFYLWRAHNIINKRLHGQSTEDRIYPKYQFPPWFLCKECPAGNLFNLSKVKEFLIRYYSVIKP